MVVENKHDYEAGLRDGQIKALEEVAHSHGQRLDRHSRRISVLEKAAWAMFGIVAMIEFFPALQRFAQWNGQ